MCVVEHSFMRNKLARRVKHSIKKTTTSYNFALFMAFHLMPSNITHRGSIYILAKEYSVNRNRYVNMIKYTQQAQKCK
jgi:hypothetical protein